MTNTYVYMLYPTTESGIIDHMNLEQEAVMDQHFTRRRMLFQMRGCSLLALAKMKHLGALSIVCGQERVWTTRSGS